MLRILFIALSLLIVDLAHAQEMSLREITHLYTDGHYEHCIRKAKSFLIKHPNEPLSYLMVALPDLQLYFISDGDKSDTLLHEAMQYALKAHLHDSNGAAMEPYSWEMNELYRVIRQRGNELYNSIHKPTSATYFNYLAAIYNDTTNEYREFYADASPMRADRNINDPDINTGKADMVIKYAESLMGTRYRSSGTTPAGFDCSGYVCYVFKNDSLYLPHSSATLATLGKEVSLHDARPGDLVFFGSRRGHSYRTSHVGIIRSNDGLGNITFIHAATTAGVTIDGPGTTSWDYWKRKLLFVRRIQE